MRDVQLNIHNPLEFTFLIFLNLGNFGEEINNFEPIDIHINNQSTSVW